MILNETYTLENGLSIPKLGLGTWFIDDDQAAEAVRTAVKLGYRLIDTAQAYGNERGVGVGVRTCGVPREELFVASKVAAELKTYGEAKKSIDETLEKMGLDYLDQMIIHSPQPWNQFRVEKRYSEENKAVWRALEDAQSEGKVRVIGVSNFLRDDLENLLSDCRVKPMVNQILLHISNTDLALLDYCREQGIHVEAYSPIAHGEALKNPAIAEMAKKYGVNAAQLCIRYVIELGAVALPKTANPDHMASNAAVDFTISSEDMETLKRTDRIADYGEFNIFPVFSGKAARVTNAKGKGENAAASSPFFTKACRNQSAYRAIFQKASYFFSSSRTNIIKKLTASSRQDTQMPFSAKRAVRTLPSPAPTAKIPMTPKYVSAFFSTSRSCVWK